MRIGDKAHYLDADGKRHAATITAVPGTGKSGAKTLNLTLSDGTTFADVPHERDAEIGAAFWREVGAHALSTPELDALAEEDHAPKAKAKRAKRK